MTARDVLVIGPHRCPMCAIQVLLCTVPIQQSNFLSFNCNEPLFNRFSQNQLPEKRKTALPSTNSGVFMVILFDDIEENSIMFQQRTVPHCINVRADCP